MTFKDYFSKQAALYQDSRPHYPKALFTYLASLNQRHELAWDCATGNGQAAVDLAAYYSHVVATDGSFAQLKNALPHKNIVYVNALAEHLSLIHISEPTRLGMISY